MNMLSMDSHVIRSIHLFSGSKCFREGASSKDKEDRNQACTSMSTKANLDTGIIGSIQNMMPGRPTRQIPFMFHFSNFFC